MKLLIISHTPHYHDGAQFTGWGPTVREIDTLTQLFDEVTHIAPVHDGLPPSSALPYTSSHVKLRGVKPAGGPRLRDKFGVLVAAHEYIQVIWDEMSKADVVHVRCPANISLFAIVLLALRRFPGYRWVKYAGNWHPDGLESWSYTFQRWWLKKNFHRGTVTVNGEWLNQEKHIHSFVNPSLTADDIENGAESARTKSLTFPLQLIFVGRIEKAKGIGRAIQIIRLIQEQGVDCQLHIFGDGPERQHYQDTVSKLGLHDHIKFYGWLPHHQLPHYYSQMHFVLLPSSSEGWPKVISEGMAYGVVPVVSAVSSIPQILSRTNAGIAVSSHDLNAFVGAILNYVKHPTAWSDASAAGIRTAPQFTYHQYLLAVQKMFDSAWQMRTHREIASAP